ncbi:MAG: hypothetical protein ACXWHF_02765 [Chthoniobacterales bacterium]
MPWAPGYYLLGWQRRLCEPYTRPDYFSVIESKEWQFVSNTDKTSIRRRIPCLTIPNTRRE